MITRQDSIDAQRRIERLAFAMVKGLNPTTAAKLLSKVCDVENFFKFNAQQLKTITHLNQRAVDDDYRAQLLRDARREMDFITSSKIKVTYYDDEDYPRRLLNCEDAPMVYYSLGNTNLDSRHMIAIVGTRHATIYGVDFTTRLIKDLSEMLDDVVIVSGLAYGIDAAAHRGALQAGVPTVAVTAHPLNQVYPADHRDLAVKMLNNGGALVTEYPSIGQVHKSNFLARNRIIAGLCDTTIVVESDIKGGALITANIASAYNRDVFAVPGRTSDQYSRGTNRLIADQTATLITDAEDLVRHMGWKIKERSLQKEFTFNLTPDQEEVLKFLKENPDDTINEMVVKTGRTYANLSDILFQLELSDIIATLPGGRYAVLVP